VDKENRTVEATFYSGAEVLRFSWSRGKYLLRLLTGPENVRLDSLNSGRAPVLDAHDAFSMRTQIGVVEHGKLDGANGRATLRYFKGDAEADQIWNKVEQGARNVSMGVGIYKMREVENNADEKIRRFEATDWEPLEISNVPIGADPGAHIQMSLSDSDPEYIEVEILRASARIPEQEVSMPDKGTAAGEARTDELKAISDEQLTDAKREAAWAATKAERLRASDIRKMSAPFKLESKFLEDLISGDNTVEQARAAIMDKLASRFDETPTDPTNPSVTMGRDERTTRREMLSNSLLHRANPGIVKLEDGARQFRGLTLLDMARECLEHAGVSTRGMSRLELATNALNFSRQGTIIGDRGLEQLGAMSSSDFPYILANTANKRLTSAYREYTSRWREFCSQSNASDFKTRYIVSLGEAATLEKVPEGGEFPYGKIDEAQESYAIKTFGRILPLTRQAIINDDLGAFNRFPVALGNAAARLEADTVWALITANPTMGDGNSLFDATNHANYTSSGTAISVDSLGVGRLAMRVQTGIDGTTIIPVTARFLVVPEGKWQLALQYTSTNYVPATPANTNPWAGTLTPLSDPRLDASAANTWYMIARPGEDGVETIEYAYLEGQEGVFMETRMGFTVDGLEMKARLDFGTAVVDWRAFYMNAGA